MLSVEQARSQILAPLSATGPEIVALPEAWNRVLAQPVIARLTQPPADVSAMDGYALRATDGALGAHLRIIGEAPAGHPFVGNINQGDAVRVFTGSIMPAGSDAVLLQEDATERAGQVIINEIPIAGRHIRRAGQDFSQGDALIAAGRRLTARDIGLAAAANYPWLTVHRRPRIAILATGDEISLPGEQIAPGGIVSSNAHALAAFIRAVGGEPHILPIAADNLAAIAAGADAARHADMLVTTGGASVGAFDLVQAGLGERGFAIDFWKIAMRPGKPLMFGALGELPVLGLPGNPVSALVCAILFLGPAIAKLSGLAGDAPATETARLNIAVPANDQRSDHLRAILTTGADGSFTVGPFTTQDSGMLNRFANADALVLRAPHAPAASPGDLVQIIRLAPLGI